MFLIVVPYIFIALCEQLLRKSRINQSDRVVLLWDDFEEFVFASSLVGALGLEDWTNIHGRNADLQDIYLYNLKRLPLWQKDVLSLDWLAGLPLE